MKTFLTTSPWITIEYMQTDDEMDEQGYGVAVMHCVICGAQEQLKYTNIPKTVEECDKEFGVKGRPDLRAQRDKFEIEHQHPECVLRPSTSQNQRSVR